MPRDGVYKRVNDLAKQHGQAYGAGDYDLADKIWEEWRAEMNSIPTKLRTIKIQEVIEELEKNNDKE